MLIRYFLLLVSTNREHLRGRWKEAGNKQNRTRLNVFGQSFCHMLEFFRDVGLSNRGDSFSIPLNILSFLLRPRL